MKKILLLLVTFLLFSACDYKLIVHSGTGSGKYDILEDTANIEAYDASEGMRFYKWSSINPDHLRCLKNGMFSSVNLIDRASSRYCLNPVYDKKPVVELTAEYVEEALEVYVEVVDGEGGGTYRPGDEVTIYSTHIPDNENLAFYKWEGDTGSIHKWYLTDSKDGRITFRAGLKDLRFWPIYKEQYQLSVDEAGNGMKDGHMLFVGANKRIKALKAKVGYRFSGWAGDIKYLDDPMVRSQYFTMPDADVELTATYEEE